MLRGMKTLPLAVTAALALAVGGCSVQSADVALAMADAVVPAAHASTMSATVRSNVVTQPLLQAASLVPVPLSALRAIAPKADPGVLALALEARQSAIGSGDLQAVSLLAVTHPRGTSNVSRSRVYATAHALTTQRTSSSLAVKA